MNKRLAETWAMLANDAKRTDRICRYHNRAIQRMHQQNKFIILGFLMAGAGIIVFTFVNELFK